MLGIDLPKEELDLIIEAVELLEEKADNASIREILDLKAEESLIGFLK